MPENGSNKIAGTEYLIHQQAKRADLIVIQTDENRPVLGKKLLQQRQPRIHHAQPSVVAVERFAFLADDLAEPLANEGAVDIVVVGPALVAGVVRRVDANALHLTGVVWEQRLEGDEVVSLDDEVAGAGVTAGEVRHVLEQVERHFQVMFDDGFLADPIECGHEIQVGIAGDPT